jgi:hypothetical protein
MRQSHRAITILLILGVCLLSQYLSLVYAQTCVLPNPPCSPACEESAGGTRDGAPIFQDGEAVGSGSLVSNVTKSTVVVTTDPQQPDIRKITIHAGFYQIRQVGFCQQACAVGCTGLVVNLEFERYYYLAPPITIYDIGSLPINYPGLRLVDFERNSTGYLIRVVYELALSQVPQGTNPLVLTWGPLTEFVFPESSQEFQPQIQIPIPLDGGDPQEPPACSDTIRPPGCVFVIRLTEKYISPEMKANYREGAAKLREEINKTEELLTFPCIPVTVTKDIVQKGLREAIKRLPGEAVKEAAKKLLEIPDICAGPTEYLSDKAREVADRFDRLANDPPDPNFTQLPTSNPDPVPDFGDDLVADATKQYADALSEVEALLEALITAVERAQGADQAGEDIWALRQTVAAADLSRAAGDVVEMLLDTAMQLESTLISFIEADLRERREALRMLAHSRHTAAVLRAVKDAGLPVGEFSSALHRLRFDDLSQLPELVDEESKQALNDAAAALRAYGDLLYTGE